MTTAVTGTRAEWTKAKRLHGRLAKIRAQEAELSAEFDAVIGELGKTNTGYVIAKELDVERVTISRVLRRAGIKPTRPPTRKAKA
jgi:hypothetical protein